MNLPDELAQAVINPATYTDTKAVDALYARIRSDYPLAQGKARGYDPFWVVSKHADIQTVSRNNDLFRSEPRSVTLAPRRAEAAIRKMTGGSPNLFRSVVQMDNPDHRAHRMLTMPSLMPQAVAKLEERLRDLARKYVDRMLGFDKRCDFASDIAFHYPIEAIMNLVGVPKQDHQKMLHFTQWLFGATDPDLRRPGSGIDDLMATLADTGFVLREYDRYFTDLADQRRTQPRDDIATLLAQANIDGEPLGHRELISYFAVLATAGHDTTAATIATSMWVLAERPELYARLRAGEPDLLQGFIEESVRWATPVKHFLRTAVEDTILSGQAITKGDLLLLAYPSGNRDEEVFEDPYTFNPERKPNRQIAFGYGGHVCIGQHLARLEMRVFWEELLHRVEQVTLDGEPKLMMANFVAGPKSLPIRFIAAN